MEATPERVRAANAAALARGAAAVGAMVRAALLMDRERCGKATSRGLRRAKVPSDYGLPVDWLRCTVLGDASSDRIAAYRALPVPGEPGRYTLVPVAAEANPAA